MSKMNNVDIMAVCHDIDFLRKKIFGEISVLESGFYRKGSTDTHIMNILRGDIKKFTSLCEQAHDAFHSFDNANECLLLGHKYESLVKRCRFFGKDHMITESRMTHTFDEYDPDLDYNESGALLVQSMQDPEPKIRKVSPLFNSHNNIVYKAGGMYSGKNFAMGNTIEEAPIRLLHAGDMYSRAVRDFSFVIDAENGLYAIPFGYATYYRISDNPEDANASYDFGISNSDRTRNVIIIKATKPIKRNTEIVLWKDHDKFANVVDPSNFVNRSKRQILEPSENYKFV